MIGHAPAFASREAASSATSAISPQTRATPPSSDRTIQKTNLLLKELGEELHWDDQHDVYMALRASLHTLRDRLRPAEAAKLASQLPLLVEGVFYDGWRPGATPVKARDRQRFLDMVRTEIGPARPNANAEHVTTAVFGLLDRHVSEGEWEDIRRMLPEGLRDLLPEPESA